MPLLKEPPLPPVPVTVTAPPLEVIFDGLLALPTSVTPAELLPLGLVPPVPVTVTLPIPPAIIFTPIQKDAIVYAAGPRPTGQPSDLDRSAPRGDKRSRFAYVHTVVIVSTATTPAAFYPYCASSARTDLAARRDMHPVVGGAGRDPPPWPVTMTGPPVEVIVAPLPSTKSAETLSFPYYCHRCR